MSNSHKSNKSPKAKDMRRRGVKQNHFVGKRLVAEIMFSK